ncbi:MAG TPA: hypothetical protein ENJ12_01555 [Thiolapillus brandeum]|uniref:Transposase IS204/IS1001/IS1096/IS1165 DDE domain-containing protein n=1 Tax=Thiolapillus brandeum TaxID=1076588 RepID=A0A831RWP7_9GAMM|nr:hypothetical protein [Thiolapillus brandeum]
MPSRLSLSRVSPRRSRNTCGGILNAVVLKVSNGPAEGLNSRIKTIKVRRRGSRNKERFANTIYFHLGGLDLCPEEITR